MIINASIVKQERTHRGWTQQQLADVSGLSLRTIQRVENQGQGSMETCSAPCSVLEMERSRLFESPPSDAFFRAASSWPSFSAASWPVSCAA